VAEENNVDKIYIIPSSIHECLLIIDNVEISSGDGIVSIRRCNVRSGEYGTAFKENRNGSAEATKTIFGIR
jgi:hypothetical protein